MASAYAHPEFLVDTAWVSSHLNDPAVRIVESDEDYLSKADFEKLCSDVGIQNDTTVVFYGDKSNWFATYALWLFQYYGHENVKIMNGGRTKWVQEKRFLSKEVPTIPRTNYKAKDPNASLRAFRDLVFQHVDEN